MADHSNPKPMAGAQAAGVAAVQAYARAKQARDQRLHDALARALASRHTDPKEQDR